MERAFKKSKDKLKENKVQLLPVANVNMMMSQPNSHWDFKGGGMSDPARFAPSQWETLFQSNAVSHWLRANLESALLYE